MLKARSMECGLSEHFRAAPGGTAAASSPGAESKYRIAARPCWQLDPL